MFDHGNLYLETFQQLVELLIMLVEAGMIKIAQFFDEKNKVGYGQQEVPMTLSKHYEHEYILLSTMTKITLTTNKDKGHLFTIECYMPSFEPQNKTVCI